jgi:hypothetical protein
MGGTENVTKVEYGRAGHEGKCGCRITTDNGRAIKNVQAAVLWRVNIINAME